MRNPWLKWTILEGLCKASNRNINKLIGSFIKVYPEAIFLITLIVGVIQGLGGLIGALSRKKSLRLPLPQMVKSVLFGITASIMSILTVYTFTDPRADVGVSTLIVSMAIIPGTFVDRWLFRDPALKKRQWFAILIFLLSGYAALNFPSLAGLGQLPFWVWLSVMIALMATANETITRFQSKTAADAAPVDPMVHVAWIGLTTVIFTAIGSTIFNAWHLFKILPQLALSAAAATGIIVIAMVIFKLISYYGGAKIGIKKLVLYSSYLILASVMGWLFYGEAITVGKVIGISGFFLAFSLMDNETWQAITNRRVRS